MYFTQRQVYVKVSCIMWLCFAMWHMRPKSYELLLKGPEINGCTVTHQENDYSICSKDTFLHKQHTQITSARTSVGLGVLYQQLIVLYELIHCQLVDFGVLYIIQKCLFFSFQYMTILYDLLVLLVTMSVTTITTLYDLTIQLFA